MAILGVISWSLFVDACRLLSVTAFVLCSLSFNWYSFITVIALLASLYILDRDKYSEDGSEKSSQFLVKNPYKGKRKIKDEDKISPQLRDKFTGQILDLVLYDVENCQALRNFEVLQRNTHCTFAKKSVLWGSCDYDRTLTVEQNVVRSLPALIKFLIVGSSLHLDGFLFELPGDKFGQTVEEFGEGVRRVLKCISDHDTIGFHCMNKSYVSKVGWSFEFGGVPIFVTTFAPCYPENHSRFSFGSENSFILLQPMYSFAIHDIGDDTPKTNWKNPQTVRDKIRCAYKDNNRAYHVRNTVVYPAAHDVVKPLKEGTGDLVEWWKDPNKACDDVGVNDDGLSSQDKFLDTEESGSASDDEDDDIESIGEDELTTEGVENEGGVLDSPEEDPTSKKTK